MNLWLLNDLAAFLLCVLCAGIVIPQILLIAFRKKLFDEPDARKIHTLAVPRLGGLAFMPVVLFSSLLITGIDLYFGFNTLLSMMMYQARPLAFTSCSVILMYVIGMADDLIGIKYSAKFVVQIICGIFMIAGGIWINSFHGILGLQHVSPWFGYPFTIIVIVFILNSINLIDGIDGLASGLTTIAFLIYAVAFYISGEYIYSMLSCCVMGVLVQFFYYNVFGDATKRKKIFMGDTGSLTIGMLIAFFSIRLEQLPPQSGLGYANMCAVAFVPLLIPCFDVLRVYGERILNHKNPFLPDKRHIHHKLLELGLKQRKAMVTLVLISLLFSFVNIILSMYININILLFGDMAIWFAAMIILNKTISARNNKQCRIQNAEC